jgi:hypothetical protein
MTTFVEHNHRAWYEKQRAFCHGNGCVGIPTGESFRVECSVCGAYFDTVDAPLPDQKYALSRILQNSPVLEDERHAEIEISCKGCGMGNTFFVVGVPAQKMEGFCFTCADRMTRLVCPCKHPCKDACRDYRDGNSRCGECGCRYKECEQY